VQDEGPDLRAPDAEAVRWAAELQRRIRALRRERAEAGLRWDERLSEIAARQARARSLGVKTFDLQGLAALGYKRPVRAEHFGSAQQEPPSRDYARFAELELWSRLARRRIGLGLARMTQGQPEAGRLVLVVVSAAR
jgi:hypothetical protein